MIDGKSIGLVSFADIRFYKSHKRLKSQAENSGFFDSISINSELDLPRDYARRNKKLLNKRVRGFGYWCWKPKIILMGLKQKLFLIMLILLAGTMLTGGTSNQIVWQTPDDLKYSLVNRIAASIGDGPLKNQKVLSAVV